MAISLTTEGLRVDYRTSLQTSASGTYPIGTVIAFKAEFVKIDLPGTWSIFQATTSGYSESKVGSQLGNGSSNFSGIAIRVL